MKGIVILGTKIRNFRKRSGLSQLQLETELGASSGTISRIENGEVNPTKETIGKISKILKLSDWEFSYLVGDLSNPPTNEEVASAQEEVKEYFDRKGILAYMVDDRSRVWAVSNDFIKFLGLKKEYALSLLGQSLIKLIIDDSLGIADILSEKEKYTMFYNLFCRTYVEMSFMEGDHCFEEALEFIKNDPFSKKIWNEILKNPPKNVYGLEQRKVNFKVHGLNIEMIYAVEPLRNNERFRIVEYTPTSKVMRLLSKLY
jgi:transcriptional regulator with XRE-family HTH domain